MAYATKYGATAEIAQKIGEVLTSSGWETDILPVKRVGDLSPYRAVILGSAVYMFRWRKEAIQFLEKNEKALAERPVWLFSSGPLDEGDPVTLLKGWRFPPAQQALADRIRPCEITVFHGDAHINKLNPIEKWMMEKFGGQDKDFRDWEAITSWATSISNALR